MPPEIDADPNAAGAGQEGEPAVPAKSPKDGDWIPKSQFLAALQNANSKNDELQARIARLESAPVKEPTPKAPTRAELLALVEAGSITQAVADAEWKRQIIAEVKSEVGIATASMSVAQRVDADLAEYKKLAGDAWVAGSPERTKVEAAYRRLVSRGLPETASTELTALENVFGDIDVLRESKKARSGPAEQHSETGGARGASGGGGPKDDAVKGLTAREKAHYERLIQAKVYKNWAAVKEERDAYAKRKAA